jgi:Peptidase family M28
MDTAETISGLTDFERRGAGSDAERRAAGWLAERLRQTGRDVRLEPFWCRPNWALAQAWHVALALGGSLLAVHSPRVGAVLILVALLSLISDWVFARSLGRMLTPERASQNVIGLPPQDARDRPVRLILTANYDAGRIGLVHRDGLRSAVAALRRPSGRLAPGWLGWLALALIALLAVALLRLEGQKQTIVGVIQLLPTVGLVLALAALVELATADFGPAANDNGSGVAAVLALTRALDASPPGHSAVEILLAGAGDGDNLGLRHHLRSRRFLRDHNTVVVGLAASAVGRPRWWESDGALLALRHFSGLRQICRQLQTSVPELDLRPYRGRGSSPVLAARLAGIPSIALGRLDDRELVPASHQPTDTPDNLDSTAIDAIVEIGVLLAEGIDRYLQAMDRPREELSAT